MKNLYPARCFRCGDRIEPGEGLSERGPSGWRTQHAGCAVLYRGKPDNTHAGELAAVAAGVGPAARKARAKLRNMEEKGWR